MRHEALLAVSVGDGLEAAFLGVRGAGLKGHHPALAGGHHHRVRQFETLPVQAVEDFQADPGAAVGAGGLPAGHRLAAGRDQFDAVGRLLAAMPGSLAGLAQREVLADVGFEGQLAVLGGGFTVGLGAGHFIVGRPVAAGGDRVQRAFERGAVLFEQGMGHDFLQGFLFGCGRSCLPRGHRAADRLGA